MKKTLVLLLTGVVLLASTVSGLAASQTVEVWHRWTGTHQENFNILVDLFSAQHSDIEVDVVVVSGQYINLTQNLLARLASGQAPPDIVFSGYNYLGYMVREFGALPLDNLGIIDPNRFVDGTLNTGIYDGKQYGLPFGISTPVLYVNSDLLAEAGVSVAELATWEGVIDAARKISSLSNKYGIYMSNVDTFVLQSLVESAGGLMIENESAAFNSEAGVEALSVWRKLYEDGSIPKITYAESQTAFAGGQIAMMVTSIMNLESFKRQGDFELVVLPFPKFGNNELQLASGGTAAMLFSAKSNQQEAAATFLRFLTTDEAAEIWARAGYLSAIKGIEPLSENQAVAYNQLPYSVAWVNWPGANGLEIEKVVNNWRDKILYGEVEVKAGLEQAAKEVNQLIRSGN